jgi:hypothetical protein
VFVGQQGAERRTLRAADLAHDGEIVRDEETRDACLLADIRKEVEHLGLD